jgi:hypothetical protein
MKSGIPFRFSLKSDNQSTMKVMRIRSNAFYHGHFAEIFNSFWRQVRKTSSSIFPVVYLKKSRQGAFLSCAPCSLAYCSHWEMASIT